MRGAAKYLGAQGVRAAPLLCLDGVTKVCYWASGLTLAAIVVVFCYEIVARYAFAAPTRWGHDTVTYLLCVGTFLAAPEVARVKGHVAITFMHSFLPQGVQRWVEVCLAITVALVCLTAAYITGIEAHRQFDRNIMTLGTFIVPKWWVSTFIPVGFFLVSLQYVSHIVRGSQVGEREKQ